jgi:O-antigen ligase
MMQQSALAAQSEPLAAQSPIDAAERKGWDWLAVTSVAIGALMYVSFQMGGQFFAGELLMLALLPILAFDRFYRQSEAVARQRALWFPLSVLLGGLTVSYTGYLLSDLYRNNAPADFMRGWARLFFLGVDLLVVAMLVSSRRANFWLLALGYGFGGAILLLAQGLPFAQLKMGYAEPLTIGGITLTCLIKRTNHRGLVLLGLGLVNVMWDYRSMGAFCVVTAAVVWLNQLAQGGREKLVRAGVMVAVLATLVGIGYYASQGSFAQRRQASNAIRLSSAMIGFSAVLESPLIGYGSWGRDTRFAKLYADVMFRMNKSEESPLYDFDLIRLATIPAHSQFLEAWIEGGLLGIGFMMCYLLLLLRGLRDLLIMKSPPPTIALMGFFMIWGLWALFMSPFKGLMRIEISLACISAIIAFQITREQSGELLRGRLGK